MSAGVPSHDRFNAILAANNTKEFETCLLSWITALHELTSSQVIAIDGKTLRSSIDATSSNSAMHMVCAWATADHIRLRQIVVDAECNEFTAIPKLLDLIRISGAIVTINAMGCQTEILEKRVSRQGDHGLGARSPGTQHHPSLHRFQKWSTAAKAPVCLQSLFSPSSPLRSLAGRRLIGPHLVLSVRAFASRRARFYKTRFPEW
jgi:hypothetical protein